MPTPNSLEDALHQLVQANPGMTRAGAIQYVNENVNDEVHSKIPNIHEDLRRENLKGEALGFVRSYINQTAAIPRFFAEHALAFAPDKDRQFIEGQFPGLTKEIPPSTEEPASPGAEFLGSLASFATPGIGPSSQLEAVPGVAKLPGIAKGAILGLTGALGDQTNPFTGKPMSPTVAGGIFGLGGGLAERGLGWIAKNWTGAAEKAGQRAESVLAPEDVAESSAGEMKLTEATPSEVSGARAVEEQFARQPRAAAGSLFQGVTRAPAGPRVQVPEAKQGWFAVPPATSKQGFARSAEQVLREKSDEYIGTLGIREGQPFQVTSHNVLQTQRKGLLAYAYPQSELGRVGKPMTATQIEKPLVIDVASTGQQSFVDAARSLYANDTNALKALDSAKDQVGLSQELIARKAQSRGFDSVSISTPDVKENTILDLRKFKSSEHPEETTKSASKGTFDDKAINAAEKSLGRKLTDEEKATYLKGVSGFMSGGGAGQAVAPETLQKLMADAKKARQAVPPGPDPEQTNFNHSVDAATDGDLEGMSPEWAAAIRQSDEASLEPLYKWRPVSGAIDHPKWQQFLQGVLSIRSQGDKFLKELSDTFVEFRKGISESEFDEVHRAWQGLKYDANYRLQQTALNVDPKHTEAALKLEQQVTSRAYTYLTGNDHRVPSLLERFNLPHTRVEFQRLRALGEGSSVGNATQEEQIVAAELAKRKWLNFNDSHDLDIIPGKGFLSFYPAENEKVKVQNAIDFLKAHQATGYGSTNAADTVAKLKKYQARLDFIENGMAQEEYRKFPNQDTIPRYKQYGPLAEATSPTAQPLWPDTNVERLSAKFVRGVIDKRQSDVVLAGARDLKADPAFQRGEVQNYITDYANAVRGSRGFLGDRHFASQWNNTIGRLTGHKITAADVHARTSWLMNGMLWTRLLISPIRFPIINMTHLFVGLYPVVGEKTFARAFADVSANPSRWFAEAAEAGAIRHESDWFREIAEQETVAGRGPIARKLQALTYLTENFRRAVAYRAGLLTEPSEWSPLVKAFDGGAASKLSPLEARKAYARGLTLTTQFETSMINKPLGFSGNPWKRLATQFKTWPSNLSTLYYDMYKKGQYGALLRGLSTLWFFGGVSAVTPGGPTVYHWVRDYFLRHGTALPDEDSTGMQNVSDTLGFQGTPIEWVTGLNLYSLHDPFALVPSNLPGTFGPFVGGAVDAFQQISRAINNEDAEGVANVALGAVSPQIRAAVEATNEYFHNGKVFGANGSLELDRPVTASIMRGLDLTPSARSQHYAAMQDMASATESGNQATIEHIREKAERDGVVMDQKFWRSVRSIVKKRQKNHQTAASFWGSL